LKKSQEPEPEKKFAGSPALLVTQEQTTEKKTSMMVVPRDLTTADLNARFDDGGTTRLTHSTADLNLRFNPVRSTNKTWSHIYENKCGTLE